MPKTTPAPSSGYTKKTYKKHLKDQKKKKRKENMPDIKGNVDVMKMVNDIVKDISLQKKNPNNPKHYTAGGGWAGGMSFTGSAGNMGSSMGSMGSMGGGFDFSSIMQGMDFSSMMDGGSGGSSGGGDPFQEAIGSAISVAKKHDAEKAAEKAAQRKAPVRKEAIVTPGKVAPGNLPRYNMGGGMGGGAGMMGMGQVTAMGDMIDSAIPDDNISKGGKVASDVVRNVENVAMEQGGPIGAIVGGVIKGVRQLSMGIAQAVKEKRKDPLNDVEYKPENMYTAADPFGKTATAKYGADMEEVAGMKTGLFNLPEHEMGGGYVDMLGNLTDDISIAIGEFEKKETTIEDTVYSDTLINPDTGNTYAVDAKKAVNDHRGRHTDIDKETLAYKSKELEKRNERDKEQFMNNLGERLFAKYGGKMTKMKKYQLGSGSSPLDIENFQGWVVDVMGDKNILTSAQGVKGSESNNYGVDSVWGDSTMAAYKKYGADYRDYLTQQEKNNTPIDLNFAEDQSKQSAEEELATQGVSQVNQNITQENDKISFEDAAIEALDTALTVANMREAFKKPEETPNFENPNRGRAEALALGAEVSDREAQQHIDRMLTANIESIDDSTRSQATRNALIQSAFLNAMQAGSATALQASQANAALDMQKASTLAGLGTEVMKSQMYSEDIAARERGAAADRRNKFLTETMGDKVQDMRDQSNLDKSNNFYANLLSQKYSDFSPSDLKDMMKEDGSVIEYAKKIEDGTITDAELEDLQKRLTAYKSK